MTEQLIDPPMHPARRSDTEAWLDALGVDWAFIELPLAEIDQAASLANQVRHEPLNVDVVDRYAADMRRGDQFPPLLVHGDTMALLGGNHRFAALLATRHTTAAAYLVDGPQAALMRVRFEDNARHGLPPTTAERVEHGVALMAQGLDQATAAAIVGLAQPKLSIGAAVLRAGERARAAGLEGFDRLPESTRYKVSQVDDEVVFAALAGATLRCALPAATVGSLVRAVSKAGTEEALRLIGMEAEEYGERARDRAGNVRRSSRTARARLDAALGEIRALRAIDVYDTCPNDDVRTVLAQRILDASRVLAASHALLTGKG